MVPDITMCIQLDPALCEQAGASDRGRRGSHWVHIPAGKVMTRSEVQELLHHNEPAINQDAQDEGKGLEDDE
jgi:hypothetical protein